ncbi:uncharacterized protein LOC126969795 [Leptidea sinapis]|uniref:uncharacterized protein LOC126969795 n=1 Tax=Leptidea sinapis TaxID=189913 RepID=UPI0021C32B3B|nr:uncharacterized protein LOC126969795 [Leptidea sinapis]
MGNTKREYQLIATMKTLFSNTVPKYSIPKSRRISYKSIKRTLCRTIGTCGSDFKNKFVQLKIEELKQESKVLIKSIAVLRTLLSHLKKSKNVSLVGNSFDNDVDKFKQILIDYYQNRNLTITSDVEKLQIQYITNTIDTFVKSLEKFALILDDLIKITEKQKAKKDLHRYRYTTNWEPNTQRFNKKKDTLDTKLVQIKNILNNFNSLQNRFMNKIYAILSSLQTNNTKVSNIRKKSIEENSKRIILNLKRLKNINLNTNITTRRKREAMNDDAAIDYLLMLMEYLMKNNKPVNVSPVNDGIDLLIEAIKNAPDMKPIKTSPITFHHLQHRTKRPFPTRTNMPSTTRKYKYHNLHRGRTTTVTENYFSHKNNTTKADIYHHKVTTLPVYIHKYEEEGESKVDNLERKNFISKFEVFNDDDDYDNNIIASAKIKNETGVSPNETNNMNTNKMDDKIWSDDNEKESNYSSLNWSKDNLEEEFNIASTTSEKTVTRTHKTYVTRTSKKINDRDLHPVSSMSADDSPEYKTVRKHNNEDEIKMNIFESSDYNTEKTDMESDSKEDKNNDNFLSDFA